MAFELERADLRCADADREECARRLHAAAMEGRLDHEELEERLSAAYAAKTCGELTRLVADVTVPTARAAPPVPPAFVRPARRMNGLAVASLILSLCWLGGIGSVAGVILGHSALRQIDASGGTQAGRGLAITSLCVGYFWLGITALMILLGIAL